MNDSDLKVSLARLDERIKSLSIRVDRENVERDKAIEIARLELARRLDILNHAHEQAIKVQSTYLSRELHEPWTERVRNIENKFSEWQGRLLPLIGAVTVVAAGIGAAVTKLVFGGP